MKIQKKDVTAKFEYELPNGETINIELGYISEEKITEIRKNATFWTWRNRKQVQEVNDTKLTESIISEGLKNIQGLRVKHIRYLVEPNTQIELDEGETWEKEIMFSDYKNIIIDNINNDFGSFIITGCRENKAFIDYKKKIELQNLGTGSSSNGATII